MDFRSMSSTQEWGDSGWGAGLEAGVGSCVAYRGGTQPLQRLVAFCLASGYRRWAATNVSTDDGKAAD